jgi:hypothetical protein
VESSEAARKYLDDAIRRHRDSGDKKSVPKDVYQRALTRIAKTVIEFQALGRRA